MSRRLVVGSVLMAGVMLAFTSVDVDAQRRGSGGNSGSRSGSARARSAGSAPQQSTSRAQASPRSQQSGRVHSAPQVRVHVGGWYGYSYGYRHYYPWAWGWGLGWGGWPWYYPPYPGYYSYGYAGASLRIQVDPRSAEVFVDGAFAGLVDDFDGIFQRLQVEPGAREITVYKEGYRTYSERLYLRVGQGYTMRMSLQPLSPGEPNEPRPVMAAPPQGQVPDWTRRPMPVDPDSVEPEEREPVDPPVTAPVVRDSRPVSGSFGQVAIRVQPGDAEVLIDDEVWRAPEGAERLVVHLRPGAHRVEVRKEGFDPFVTSVDVKKGETVVLNVSLGRLSGV